MAIEYRLLTFGTQSDDPTAGILVGDRIYPAANLLKDVPGIADPSSVFSLLQSWDLAHPRLHTAAARLSTNAGIPLREVTLLAPILYPGALFCAGANYWDHLKEMAEIARRTTGKSPSMEKPVEPWFFLKTSRSSIIG